LRWREFLADLDVCQNSDGDSLQENSREANVRNVFFSVVVELNYYNNSKRKRKNGGQGERREEKERERRKERKKIWREQNYK
jgi:hypothetical protein